MTLLKKLDDLFAKRQKTEILLINATIFLGIMALVYQYLFPWSEKLLKEAKAKKEAIENKINADKAYIRAMSLNGDSTYYIKQYTKTIQELKKRFHYIKAKEEYLDHKIRELSYLLYNKKKWAQFLNSLTQKAAKNRVEINYILNNFLDVTKNFGHVLEVEISCNGDFNNLISYINDIEQSDLVVDVYELSIVNKNPLETIFKVSVWGINY